jgi:hypothetical protein
MTTTILNHVEIFVVVCPPDSRTLANVTNFVSLALLLKKVDWDASEALVKTG